MGKRGIEPPMFTAWELIYSQLQHRQSLPLPQELEHQESNPGLTGYKPVALPLSYVPKMAGGGFEPPISELWALRDNLFSILQAAARSRTGNLLITGQLLCL